MRFLTRSLLGLFLTFLTLALLFLAGFQLVQAMQGRGEGAGRARPAGEQVYAARLVAVQAGVIRPELQVFGQVRSRRELQLRAGAAGRIVQLDPALQEGGTVVAGQLLARIDPAAAQAALDSRQAERDDAQGTLRDAVRRVDIADQDVAAAERQAQLRDAALDRQNQLGDRGLGTTLDRETAELAASSAQQTLIASRAARADAESAVTAAENALRRAEIALAEARRALTDTEIRAGFDGRVTGVTVVEGALVGVNEQLATIVDPAALEVQIPLSLDQFARLLDDAGALIAQDIRVMLPGAGGVMQVGARLDRAAASVAEGGAGRVVYGAITDGGALLRPGDFVSLAIPEPPLEGVAMLPATAVGSDGTVLAADAEGRLTALPAQVLRRQGDQVIIRVSDALDGARVVAERAPQLGTGIRIREIGQDEAATGTAPRAETVAAPAGPDHG